MDQQQVIDEINSAIRENRAIYTIGDTIWKATMAYKLSLWEEYWASEQPISIARSRRDLEESDTARPRFKSNTHEIIAGTNTHVFTGKLKFGHHTVGRDIVKGVVPESVGFGEIDAKLIVQEGSVAFFIVPDLMHRPAKPAQATAEAEEA